MWYYASKEGKKEVNIHPSEFKKKSYACKLDDGFEVIEENVDAIKNVSWKTF